MAPEYDYSDIPGTYVLDGESGRRGYHLNRFCMSLNQAENRERFGQDEEAYIDGFGVTAELSTAQGHLAHARTDLRRQDYEGAIAAADMAEEGAAGAVPKSAMDVITSMKVAADGGNATMTAEVASSGAVAMMPFMLFTARMAPPAAAPEAVPLEDELAEPEGEDAPAE